MQQAEYSGVTVTRVTELNFKILIWKLLMLILWFLKKEWALSGLTAAYISIRPIGTSKNGSFLKMHGRFQSRKLFGY